MKKKKFFYYMACDIDDQVWYYYISFNKKAIQEDLEGRGIEKYIIYDPQGEKTEGVTYIDLTKTLNHE